MENPRHFSHSMNSVYWSSSSPLVKRSNSTLSTSGDWFKDAAYESAYRTWAPSAGDYPHQVRFQQRLMAEKEKKIVAVFEAQQARALQRVGATVTQPLGLHKLPQGKVRAMFQERRSKGGIVDRNKPLQPISNTTNSIPSLKSRLPKATTEKTAKDQNQNIQHVRQSIKQKPIVLATAIKNQETIFNPHKDESDVVMKINAMKGKSENKSKNYGLKQNGDTKAIDEAHKYSKKVDGVKESNGRSKVSAVTNIPNRGILKKTGFPTKIKDHDDVTNGLNCAGDQADSNETKSFAIKDTSPTTVKQSTVQKKPTVLTNAPTNVMTTVKSVKSVKKKPSPNSVQDINTVPCPICSRRFAADRLPKHETICAKASKKKRKPYDALKHRLQGTEAEPFIGQIRRTNPVQAKSVGLNRRSAWKQKHEEFIATIKSAKKVQAHIDAGGKLSDLPPPPPSSNPDYIQCPHCKRKFNQAAAERHIPQCATYQYNKPKPR